MPDDSSMADVDAWKLSEPEPTNIVALWPDRAPPTLTEIVAAIRSVVSDLAIDEHLEADPDGDAHGACDGRDIHWCAAASAESFPAPFVVWVQPAHPIPPDELPSVDTNACRWVVGFETILDRDQPFEHYACLVEMIARALPSAPAVLDVNTTRWFPRAELDEIFLNEIEPPAEVLWVVQAVMSEPDGDDEPLVWLHTHGLWRCGVPELEMLEVPGDYIEAAAELVNDVASLILEQPAPQPGESLEIGTELAIVLQPWEEVVRRMPADAPGGATDRSGDGSGPHTGARAVICAEKPRGQFTDAWVWPRDVTERLMRDEAGVYMTARATERQARLARSAWDQLATAFAATECLRNGCAQCDEPVVFGVKAGFDVDGEEGSREHVWFRVRRFAAETVEGELLNQPFALPNLSKGDAVWIGRAQVSDWRVMTPDGCFGPNLVTSMWRAIDRIKDESAQCEDG